MGSDCLVKSFNDVVMRKKGISDAGLEKLKAIFGMDEKITGDIDFLYKVGLWFVFKGDLHEFAVGYLVDGMGVHQRPRPPWLWACFEAVSAWRAVWAW